MQKTGRCGKPALATVIFPNASSTLPCQEFSSSIAHRSSWKCDRLHLCQENLPLTASLARSPAKTAEPGDDKSDCGAWKVGEFCGR